MNERDYCLSHRGPSREGPASDDERAHRSRADFAEECTVAEAIERHWDGDRIRFERAVRVTRVVRHMSLADVWTAVPSSESERSAPCVPIGSVVSHRQRPAHHDRASIAKPGDTWTLHDVRLAAWALGIVVSLWFGVLASGAVLGWLIGDAAGALIGVGAAFLAMIVLFLRPRS